MTMWPRVNVTGHRDLSPAQLVWLRGELDRVTLKLTREHGTTDAATGMALCSDLEFGWSALHAGMRLHAHIPYPQQPNGRDWTDADRDTYTRLLTRCTSKVEYGPAPATWLLFRRNDGLLDFTAERAGAVVAIWDGRRIGGTFDTVKKAATRGLPVIHFDVRRLQVHGPACSCVAGLMPPASPQTALFE